MQENPCEGVSVYLSPQSPPTDLEALLRAEPHSYFSAHSQGLTDWSVSNYFKCHPNSCTLSTPL